MKPFYICVALALAPVALTASASAQSEPNLMQAPVKWPTIEPTVEGELDHFDGRVAALQYLLRARGVYKGRADGIYGPKTVAAVKAFQRHVGLKPDGIAGPRTLPRLVIPVRRGSKGDAVRAAQILARGAMNHSGEQGNLGLETNGVFDKRTEEAVRYAQDCENQSEDFLKPDGIMGPRSWCLLLGGEVVGSKFS